MKKALILLVFVFFNLSVQAGWGPDLCEDVACSGHGYCEEDGSDEWCVCDAGYISEGLNCVLGCDGETCSDHGTCEVGGGTQYCLCESGFHAVGMQCIVDGASSVDNLIILNESECSNTGNCHYRFIFATNYYNFTPENASLYDIIINVKDPENNWHNYWKTVETCTLEGICITLDDQYIDFQWDHRISGSQYIAVEVTGNGDDAYDHIYHTCSVPCGNGVVEGYEECDDGNFVDFDGCTGCRKDFYIGNPEECETERYCEFVFSEGFVDKMRENSESDKEIKIEIGFGDGGSFSKSLNYCLKNRYCFEDEEGNVVFKKKYYNDQIQAVTAETSTPFIGSTDHGTTDTGGEVEPCVGECFIMAAKFNLTPQQYVYEEGNEDYIGSLFVAERLFDLSNTQERALNDMRVHGWYRYFPKDTKIFIYADVPAGYEIKNFNSAGDYGWSMNEGDAPVIITKEGLVPEVAYEMKLWVDENDDIDELEKPYVKYLIDIHAEGGNFYEDTLNDPALSDRIPNDQRAVLVALSNYKPSSFFALYKMIAPANFSTVEGELQYNGSFPEIFTCNETEVDEENQNCDEIFGKTGQDLWRDLIKNIDVSEIKICISTGNDGSDDDVYVKFNDVDDKVAGNNDGYRPSLFYLDNAKNNFEPNVQECFIIDKEQVQVFEIGDIKFIKLAKYPFYRDGDRPDLNPGTDGVDIKEVSLFVNGVNIFKKVFSPDFFMDGNDGGVPELVITKEEIFSSELCRLENSKRMAVFSGEVFNEYPIVDFVSEITVESLKARIEDSVGHKTEVENTYHQETDYKPIDLHLETSTDRVKLNYVDTHKIEVSFGLTDSENYLSDWDMYVFADIEITRFEDVDENGNTVFKRRIEMKNFTYDFDGHEALMNLLTAFVTVMSGYTWFTSIEFFVADHILWSSEVPYGVNFEDYIEQQKPMDLEEGISEGIITDIYFTEDYTLHFEHSDLVRGLKFFNNVFLTCIDDEIEGSLDCLQRYPNTIELIENLTSGE